MNQVAFVHWSFCKYPSGAWKYNTWWLRKGLSIGINAFILGILCMIRVQNKTFNDKLTRAKIPSEQDVTFDITDGYIVRPILMKPFLSNEEKQGHLISWWCRKVKLCLKWRHYIFWSNWIGQIRWISPNRGSKCWLVNDDFCKDNYCAIIYCPFCLSNRKLQCKWPNFHTIFTKWTASSYRTQA